MNPLLISGLLNLAPGLIGKLLGDPNKKLRKQIMKLLSPANLAKVTDQFYQQNVASPAFSQAQGAIAAGANQAGADVARNIAGSGLGTSGVGAIVPALQSSLVGSQQAGLRTSAFQGAQNQAQQNIQNQIATLGGTSGPSPAQTGFAQGINDFAPMLAQWLAQRNPGAPPARRMGDQNFSYYVGGRP